MDDARRISIAARADYLRAAESFLWFAPYGDETESRAGPRASANRTAESNAGPEPSAIGYRALGLARVYEKLIEPAFKRKYFVSDLSRLNYPLMREMLASIRQRAARSGLAKVPVVLTNHPKDMRDWEGLERFVGEVAEADDVEFITLTEVAEKITSGEFKVRKSAVRVSFRSQ